MVVSRIMYDSDMPSAIPPDAQIVAGYVDGEEGSWTQADWDARPLSRHVTITRVPSVILAEVLDVETGAATAADAPEWAQKVRYIGGTATIYTSLSNWPTVITAFLRAGVPAPWYWIADWDGNPTIPAGAMAKQYRSPVAPPGNLTPGHYDMSVVVSAWPPMPKPKPAPPKPAPKPAPKPTEAQIVSGWGKFAHWIFHRITWHP